ncbi:AAA family ATPase [Streptosporangiaceae bacterium NEAU-GS5]|nr:AAA family ATPase [Streptosporangiaceae bacterium NEAU-GS5]
MSESVLDRETLLKGRTYATRLADVKNGFVGREEAVDLIALALLCREHALLIGPPGTAKTSLMERFRVLLDARYFAYLLTRFTEPAELFGPIDFQRFKKDSVYRLNTAGMLPEAQIAFLDEIFQGSSAILNSLLTIINERRIYNGSERVNVELVTLLGSSNEIPDDPLLAAFSDRFLLRCRLDYVADDALDNVLDLGWRGEQEIILRAVGDSAANGGAKPGFSLEDLQLLQRAVADIDLSAIRGPFATILRSFRAEGVAFSDRRAVKAMKTFAAHALLGGRKKAELLDLAPLVHLWSSPRDEPSIRRIVADHDIPVDVGTRVVRDPAEVKFELRQLIRQREHVSSHDECRELLRRLHRLTVELRRDHPESRELAADVAAAQRDVLDMYREKYAEEGLYGV